jgi:hypothetical protein
MRNGTYSPFYVKHNDYSENPQHYIRAFKLIQKDLQHLFTFVEPSDINLKTYSFRIYELFFRTCVEIETNFKAILSENGYLLKENGGSISDYKLVNKTHHLSEYEISIPYWKGEFSKVKPFEKFSFIKEGKVGKESTPPWHDAYTRVKHDRQVNFEQANMQNLISAVCGLVALLSSQFYNEDFTNRESSILLEGPNDGMESAIGGYFRVKFPNDWADDEKYDFECESVTKPDWEILQFPYKK